MNAFLPLTEQRTSVRCGAVKCVSVSSGRKHVSALMITQDPLFLNQVLITPFVEFVHTSSGKHDFSRREAIKIHTPYGPGM
jgi:hypothetical protein